MKKIIPQLQDGKYVGYRVTTMDNSSLGLRRNPFILQYPVKEWYKLPESWLVEGAGDFGGIWLSRTPSRARHLVNYIWNTYNRQSRVYLSNIDEILFCNANRIKTNGIYMISEMKMKLNFNGKEWVWLK